MMAEDKAQLEELERLAEQEADTMAGEWQPKEEETEQAGELNTADVIAPLLKVTFSMLASIRGQHWAITDEVATEAANEYGKCVDHYFPDMGTAPWVGAVVVTGMLIAPRIIEDNRTAAAQEAAAKGGENEGGGESSVQTGDTAD